MKRLIILLLLCVGFVPSVVGQMSYEEYEAYCRNRDKERFERREGWLHRQAGMKHQLRVGYGFRPVDGHKVFTFGLDYGFRAGRNFEFAASLYSGVATPYYYLAEGYSFSLNTLSGALYARYSWLNRSWLALYSTLGVNSTYVWQSKGYDAGSSESSYHTSFSSFFSSPVNIEIIPIGIRLGRRYFGYWEPFGYSARGVYSMFGFGMMF